MRMISIFTTTTKGALMFVPQTTSDQKKTVCIHILIILMRSTNILNLAPVLFKCNVSYELSNSKHLSSLNFGLIPKLKFTKLLNY